MPDRDAIINALSDGPEPFWRPVSQANALAGGLAQADAAPSLADVVRNFFAAPRMQQIPRLPKGEPVPSPMGPIGDALKSWSNTPGAITNALGYIPEDVATAMNFVVPGAKIPPRNPALERAQANFARVKAQEPGAGVPLPSYPEAVPQALRLSSMTRSQAIERFPPRNLEGLSLSSNVRPGGNDFNYLMYRDGQFIGNLSGNVQGPRAHISWVGGDGGPQSLGVSGLRQLREQMRADFPDVKTFEGHRVSGSRRHSDDKMQSVTIPGTAVGVVSLGEILNALSQESEAQ